jgi:hypothetical protein
MASGLGVNGFLRFLYSMKNPDKPRTRFCSILGKKQVLPQTGQRQALQTSGRPNE